MPCSDWGDHNQTEISTVKIDEHGTGCICSNNRVDDSTSSERNDIKRPSTDTLKSLFSPWLELAVYAYKYHKDGTQLKEKIKELLVEEYRVLQHCTDVEAGEVGYYLATDKISKILIGIKGTTTSEEMIIDCLATSIPHKCVPHSPFDADWNSKLVPEQIGAHDGILVSSVRLLEKREDKTLPRRQT